MSDNEATPKSAEYPTLPSRRVRALTAVVTVANVVALGGGIGAASAEREKPQTDRPAAASPEATPTFVEGVPPLFTNPHLLSVTDHKLPQTDPEVGGGNLVELHFGLSPNPDNARLNPHKYTWFNAAPGISAYPVTPNGQLNQAKPLHAEVDTAKVPYEANNPAAVPSYVQLLPYKVPAGTHVAVYAEQMVRQENPAGAAPRLMASQRLGVVQFDGSQWRIGKAMGPDYFLINYDATYVKRVDGRDKDMRPIPPLQRSNVG